MTRARGFTLIELLVVVAIIGMMASILITSVTAARMQGRDAVRKESMAQLQRALELYYSTYGYYPPARPSSTCGGYRPDWATSFCSSSNWLTTDDNFLRFIPVVPRDPVNQIGSDDTPWWYALTYTYGVSADGQSFDLLGNLENAGDGSRCELKLYHSVAVWPTDTGCWSTATLGNVPARAKQIWSPK